MFNLKIHNGEWYKAQWLEYIPAETTEDEKTYATVGIDFNYSSFTDNKGITYPLPGMRSNGMAVTIITSDGIEFKILDKIVLPDGSTFKIKNITKIRQTSNNMAAFSFPGASDDYVRYIITL